MDNLPRLNSNSMNNGDVSVQNLSDEQDSDVNEEERRDLTRNQSNSKATINFANEVVKTSNNPTPLEFSCWSTYPNIVAIGANFVFTAMVIVVGVLIVCFTTKKPIHRCEMNFKRTAKNPIEYNYGPRSVAIGDFNNDTWLDMVVANYIVNNIAIYLGDRNGTFSTPYSYSTGSDSAPHMVAVGDLNNDDRLDIAVANFDTNNVVVFLGFGDGSFASAIELSTGASRPQVIHLVDLNSDKLLDIATVNYGTQSFGIFYGYGNGSFSKPAAYSTGYDSFPCSLITGDFDNDNHLDLAIANYGTNNVGVHFGNSNGTFAGQVIFSTGAGSHPSSIACGYFNDDDFLDIAVAYSGTNKIGILQNNGYGAFVNQTIYSIDPASPYSIGVGDVNRDNRLDLVITNRGADNIGVLLGYGNGSFSSSNLHSTGSVSSISFALGDLNKDNRLDAIVVNNDTGAIDILYGYFEGFSNRMAYSTGSHPCAVAAGDFNNDTHLDIVVTNGEDNTVSIFFGHGNGSFATQIKYLAGTDPSALVLGDFNKDTRLDMIVTNAAANEMSVLLQSNTGALRNDITYASAGVKTVGS